MGFARNLANIAVSPLAATLGKGLFKKKNEDKPYKPQSLITEGYNSNDRSLIGSSRGGY